MQTNRTGEEMYREHNRESNHLVFNGLGRTNWKIKEHRSHYTQVRIFYQYIVL